MSDDTPVMRDLPMLASDREFMQQEFTGFDGMTLEEFRLAARGKADEILDAIVVVQNAERSNT